MEGIRCPAVTVNHLRVSPDLTSYAPNSTVYVNCEYGYKLSGDNLLHCNNGMWIPGIPDCTKSRWISTKSSSTLIIAVCSIASLVGLVIIICVVYMLTKNWRHQRALKRQQKACQKQIMESSNYFSTCQDCVGMPPLVFENISPVIRGRSTTSSISSATTCTASTDISLDGELSAASEKVFIY